jgi:hypothetical protein
MDVTEDIDGAGAQASPSVRPLRSEGAEIVRLWPIRVLVISPDRYFRAAAAMLIGRRGCAVLTADSEGEALELAGRERIDVLLLERPTEEDRRSWDVPVRRLASAVSLSLARQGVRCAPVGVVVVSERYGTGDDGASSPESLEVDKWGPFEELFRAIVRADRHRRLPRERRFLPWPAAARPPRAD